MRCFRSAFFDAKKTLFNHEFLYLHPYFRETWNIEISAIYNDIEKEKSLAIYFIESTKMLYVS